MKGLIIKDILNLKKQIKTVFFIILIYAGFSLTSSNDYSNMQSSFISGIIILLSITVSISSFSYDEYSKWDKYAASLPVSRKNIVLSKYILSILFLLAGFIVSLLYTIIIMLTGNTVNILETILSICIMISIAILIISILLPSVYKFGVEKARILMFAIYFTPTIIIVLLSRFNLVTLSENQLMLIFKLLPVFAIVILIISFLISCKIFEKKEL